jgi:hypothetical protein
VIPGLNQLPAFHPFLPEEIGQPLDPFRGGIVDKTTARLIAFNDLPWFCGFDGWKLVKRNLIFPLNHKPSFRSEILEYWKNGTLEEWVTKRHGILEVWNVGRMSIERNRPFFRNPMFHYYSTIPSFQFSRNIPPFLIPVPRPVCLLQP